MRPFASFVVSLLTLPMLASAAPATAQIVDANIAGRAAPASRTDPQNLWLLDLSDGGRVTIWLRPDAAPKMVERIKTLTRQHFYDGLTFHRVIDGFMAQGGDPKGDGTGGSTLPNVPAEFNYLPHVRGSVAAARAEDENSANSQFYIVFQPRLALDKKYTVFGRVLQGMEWVDKIERGEPPTNPTKIVHAYIAADNPPAYANMATPTPVAAAATLPAGEVAAPKLAPGTRPAPTRKAPAKKSRRPMDVDLFDFTLPPERIALRPASPRDAARLLFVGSDGRHDRHVTDLPAILQRGDMLVFNNTRVIPAQLEGRRGDARIGATLHKREGPRRWRAFIRNARRLRAGDPINFGAGVMAIASDRGDDGSWALDFASDEPVELLLDRAGRMPLPPYIAARRATDERDADDYQTMFAAEPGAVAAPTAALHFTPALLDRLSAAGIDHLTLTLHVGAGTFLPVKATDTEYHRMHAEWGRLPAAAAERLNEVRAAGGRVIAVGTTSLRLIETATDPDSVIQPFEGDTSIFITPGYRFRGIDGLLTNFHLPRSTLFMLVSALMGLDTMQAAYRHAIDNGYRFYSYGDASLLLPNNQER